MVLERMKRLCIIEIIKLFQYDEMVTLSSQLHKIGKKHSYSYCNTIFSKIATDTLNQIPLFIVLYNQNMGGTDVTDVYLKHIVQYFYKLNWW